jgi:ATP-dependent RNA helicase RhlE
MWKQLRKNTTVMHKYILRQREKTELIIKLITEGNWKQILVFTRTKQGANKLTESMISAGIKAAIHGNKGQRTKALAGFKDGSLTALVATDIAAEVWTFRYYRMLSILNCLTFLKITFTALVEQEELEQAEKLFRYSVRNGFLRDIEKLVGLNLPKEKNIRVSSQILMLPKNQSNKDKKTTTRFNSAKKKPKTHYKPKQQ